MSKSNGRAFESGIQPHPRKATHAPLSADNRKDALCGLTNTSFVGANQFGSRESFGRTLDIWKGDRVERMVNCQRCRKALGL